VRRSHREVGYVAAASIRSAYPGGRAMRRRATAAASASLVACAVVAGAFIARPASATPNLGNASVSLTTVATGLSKPTDIAWRHGDTRMYVTEQTGTVRIVAANGTPVSTPVLTVPVSGGNEQGMLGLTFSSDGTKLYVDYTDPSGNIHVDEYTMNGDVANTATKRQILLQTHTQFANHNGGELTFGPDGMLYIGIGDGGSAGDPNGNAQNLSTWLGKILRINPNQNGANPYSVPSDNPFVGQSPKLPEIWMYGLRNPWRFSFDRSTGDTWIGDVGQDLYEEIDLAAQGQSGINWGWNLREGLHPYNGGAEPPGARDPIVELPHTSGYCAVIGGYVYRGSAIADLGGSYVFGDSCRANLVAVAVSGGHVTLQRDLGVSVSSLTTFAEDPSGEL
jgi:glucose/arabinose dehydrogenase